MRISFIATHPPILCYFAVSLIQNTPPAFCLLPKRTILYRTVLQNVEKRFTKKRVAVSTQSSATPNAAHGYRADRAKTIASVDHLPFPAQARSPKHKKNASKAKYIDKLESRKEAAGAEKS